VVAVEELNDQLQERDVIIGTLKIQLEREELARETQVKEMATVCTALRFFVFVQ
jgi:hypothetical protein